MKKLQTKETFAGTRIDILNPKGDVLCSIDHLAFSGNKMDAKLFAGQMVNAWNNTYGEGIEPSAVPDLLEALKAIRLQNGMIEHNWDYREKNYMSKVMSAITKAQPSNIRDTNETGESRKSLRGPKSQSYEFKTGTMPAVILGIDHAIEEVKKLDIDNKVKESLVNIFKALRLLTQPE